MLKLLTAPEQETFERLRDLFGPAGIRFTLVGGAACREYGLNRPVKDLDFVVNPYPDAKRAIHAAGVFVEVGVRDPTHRTSTFKDSATKVQIDILTGGIRITDRAPLKGFVIYSDPIPIPQPSGFGDLIPLNTLIEMKVGAIVSGLDTAALGANYGGRTQEEIERDVEDVRGLISIHHLSRDVTIEEPQILQAYQNIFDGAPVISQFAATT